MRKSTGLDELTGLTELGPLGVQTWLDDSVVLAGSRLVDDPMIVVDDVDAWARHAHASSGFGDTPVEETPRTERPWSGDVHAAARTQRAHTLVSALIAIAITAMRVVHDGWARYLRGRQARLACHALRQLDDRGLRDLGLDRSEISSIAAEFAGETPYARIRGNAAF